MNQASTLVSRIFHLLKKLFAKFLIPLYCQEINSYFTIVLGSWDPTISILFNNIFTYIISNHSIFIY